MVHLLIASCLYLFYLSCYFILTNSYALTSNQPIILNIKRLSNVHNYNSSINDQDYKNKLKNGRTNPSFFLSVLGIHPGQPFEFNLQKWKAIQHSGLFYNLTALSKLTPHGVVLNISGYELPSISFSPEATLVASIDNPEIIGGVSILYYIAYILYI